MKPADSHVTETAIKPALVEAAVLFEAADKAHSVGRSAVQQTDLADRARPPVAAPADRSAPSLPFAVRQVSCGPIASITTAGGLRLFEGASYHGYMLMRTGSNQLQLVGPHEAKLAC